MGDSMLLPHSTIIPPWDTAISAPSFSPLASILNLNFGSCSMSSLVAPSFLDIWQIWNALASSNQLVISWKRSLPLIGTKSKSSAIIFSGPANLYGGNLGSLDVRCVRPIFQTPCKGVLSQPELPQYNWMFVYRIWKGAIKNVRKYDSNQIWWPKLYFSVQLWQVLWRYSSAC